MYLKRLAARAFMIMMTLLLAHSSAEAEFIASPLLGIVASYDSNPFSHGADTDVSEDYVLTVSPQLGLKRDGRTYTLSGSYRADAKFYAHEPIHNYVAHTATLGADIEASKLTKLGIHDTYSFTKDSLAAFGEGIQTRRTDITRNTLTLSADHELNSGTTLTLNLSDSISRFDDVTLVDTRTDSAEFGGSKTLSPGRTLGAFYTYTLYNFDGPGGPSNSETHAVRLDFSSEVARELTADLSAGAVYKPGAGNNYDYTGKAALTKEFMDSTASIGFSRDISSSQGLSRETLTSDSGYLTLGHNFSESFSMSLTGDVKRGRSEPSRTVDLISYSTGLSIDWRVKKWLGASVSYSRFVQWSDLGLAGDIKKDSVGINLTFTPEQWRL